MLTEHIELPDCSPTALWIRKQQHRWQVRAVLKMDEVLATFDTKAEAVAAVEELRVRIEVARTLGA